MLSKETIELLQHNYPGYKIDDINADYIHPDNFNRILNRIIKDFSVEVAGESAGGKKIFKIKYGHGKTKILIWTQMHGDEPTATAAILDLLNFLNRQDDINNLKKKIKENLTLSIIPMLNPDGAELFTRENLIGIDINRDALRLQSPEARALMKEFENFGPDFSFNMHDQNRYYTIGSSDKLPAISFLAPPFDYNCSLNPERIRSMKLIVELNRLLSIITPDSTARYNDEHEPRSFGDNFAGKGSSVILIESGNTLEPGGKEFIRKLNFFLLLTALDSIADNSYMNNEEKLYFDIPENKERMYDIILRNTEMEKNNHSYIVDIGIKRAKKYDVKKQRFYYKSSIEEIGDLSTFTAWEDYDLKGFSIKPLKYFPSVNVKDFTNTDITELLKNGYGFIAGDIQTGDGAYTLLPINLAKSNKPHFDLKIGEPANFMLSNKANEYYILINGFMVSDKELNCLRDLSDKIANALVYD
ncbi:M14 family zinc carboxypeptidase [Melioribacter sp. Ez-97]|uniref:M14 family zinc carboxypeptidase n=1 Tax=Melioribacter sp. Ez-97 TaxID=3423434 RepID=UPI003ED97468